MAELTIKTITAENTWTDTTKIGAGYFSLSIQGLTDSTVTVQKTYDRVSVSTWYDVDTFTANSEEIGFEPEDVYYRVGVKTGQYGTDTITVRLGSSDLPQ